MKLNLIGSAVFALALVSINRTAAVAAPLPQLDSSSFSNQYNGDAYPVPNYTQNGTFDSGPTLVAGGLSYQSSSGNGYFVSNDWPSTVTATSGFTVEVSAQIGTDAPQGPNGVFYINPATGAAGLSEPVIYVGQSSVAYLTAGNLTVIDTNDNTTGFNTFRIAEVGSTNVFDVWRDGVLLTPTGIPGAFAGDPSLLVVGDGSGNTGGPTVTLGYIRFDAGAFAPVVPAPEPSSLVLGGLGTIGMAIVVRRRRARQQASRT